MSELRRLGLCRVVGVNAGLLGGLGRAGVSGIIAPLCFTPPLPDILGSVGSGQADPMPKLKQSHSPGGMADWTALAQSQLARYLDGPALAVPPIQSGRAWAHDGGGPGRPMGFGEAIASVFGKYATFSGRASRSEYWYFLLFYLLVNIGANFVASGPVWYGPGAGGPLLALIPLAFFLPSIAVAVRRLHDIDRTGWWLLIAFIPVIGAIVLLVFACTAPSPGQNRYG